MTSLTPSHQMLGLIQSSATIPIMLFGVFAGAIADNYNRRMVMLTSQVAMLVISAVLALLTWLDLITPWPLLVLTLLLGIGIALNSPAWQASVREQVGIRDLPQAVSLNTIAFNLARTAGPALGGLVISLWSVSAAFAINAICRPPLILAVFRWRSTAPPPVKNPMLPAIATGIRFCAGSSPVRRILLRGLVLGFGIAGYHALLPAVVRYQLKGSETQFGALLAVFGLGSILAALVIGPARRRWGTERVLMLATAGFGVAQLVLAHATSVATALPATFIAGGAWVACLTTVNVAMQLRSPNAILGRCLSIYQTITFGGMAVGSYLWGLVADWRGLPFALQAAAVFLASTLLLLRLFAPMPGRDEGRVDADTGEIAPM
jgi:MFS family permease